jgi:four helix bundle protein
MQAFVKLKVWQVAHDLALGIYSTTRMFPDDERYGLAAQLRRSSISILANIAEASAARHRREFARILNIAEREGAETLCHLIMARDLGYISAGLATEMLDRVEHVRRMLFRLHERVTSSLDEG